MKIDRLIGILSILLQRDKITASELAEKFEVSRRTIVRDIEDISKAGIPITASQGRNGGISIMDGFKLDRTLLSTEDMKAILTGLQGLDSVSESSRYRRLMEKLSAENAVNMESAGNSIIVDLSSWDKSMVSSKLEIIKSEEAAKKFPLCIILPNAPKNVLLNRTVWFSSGQIGMRGGTVKNGRTTECSS